MNYPLFSSQAENWIEIISSLSYSLLSYFVWLHVHTFVHMHTHTHTHTHTHRENSANFHLQVGMWFRCFFFKFLSFLIYFLVCWVFVTVWGFSSCGKWGLPSTCGTQASHCCGFSCCEVWVQLLRHMGLLPRGMWNPSGPRIEPISPALAGGFLTTGPPGKPRHVISGNVLAMVFSGLNPQKAN